MVDSSSSFDGDDWDETIDLGLNSEDGDLREGESERSLQFEWATPPSGHGGRPARGPVARTTPREEAPSGIRDSDNGELANQSPTNVTIIRGDIPRNTGNGTTPRTENGRRDSLGEPASSGRSGLKVANEPRGQVRNVDGISIDTSARPEFSRASFNCILKDLKHTADGSMVVTFIIPYTDVDDAISLRHAYHKVVVASIQRKATAGD